MATHPDPDAPLELFRTRVRAAPPSPGTPSAHTADRGAGAPDPRTARDAVRAEAVHMGSSDPDSAWVQRHRALSARARREHAAEANGHLAMFEYTPGSQTIAARALDPFHAFDDAWFRCRGRAEETFEGVSNYAIQLFAQARSIVFTPPLHARPVGGRWIQRATEAEVAAVDPIVEARVDIGGYAFAATGATPLDAVNALAARAIAACRFI